MNNKPEKEIGLKDSHILTLNPYSINVANCLIVCVWKWPLLKEKVTMAKYEESPVSQGKFWKLEAAKVVLYHWDGVQKGALMWAFLKWARMSSRYIIHFLTAWQTVQPCMYPIQMWVKIPSGPNVRKDRSRFGPNNCLHKNVNSRNKKNEHLICGIM